MKKYSFSDMFLEPNQRWQRENEKAIIKQEKEEKEKEKLKREKKKKLQQKRQIEKKEREEKRLEKERQKKTKKEARDVPSEPNEGSLTGKIARLQKLYKNGTLTKAEFEQAKNQLLK